MQLEQSPREASWEGTVPNAVDGRVVGLVVVTAGLAASINVPYGGLAMAAAAFAIVTGLGLGCHLLGERKLRRITDDLVERWVAAGGEIEGVTRSATGTRTEWRVHTPEGDIVIGGVALVPIARLCVEWRGIADTMAASEAEERIDSLAESLYREIFELGSASQRS
ncbi:hypothetical protein A6E15_00940 [Natrinema saccharevitans]|uniref:Uncharacterized protein n=1 Tax=Natrinema saccharevitans TaxID=301967 RepID=A0A1S8ASD5_9EURY|nr:hypothetical protein [Natrinema saccharevitans]OLZ39635.1 hypothetical protein A6E15_00940 [Natrinema saccharevitans]